MARIPAKYAKYYDRGYRARMAREAAADSTEKSVGAQEVLDTVESVHPAVEDALPVSVVETPAVSDSQDGIETDAVAGSATEDSVVEEGDAEPVDSSDATQGDLPEEERGVMPDYSSMTWQELRKLISSEEEATLPDLKKATLVQHLVQKWEGSGA